MVNATVTQFDLALQICILSVLAVSMFLEKKKKVRLHGHTMIVAVVLNIVSFALIMGPAWDQVGEGSTGLVGAVAMGHVATGSLAFLVGIFLAGSWFLSSFFFKAETPKFMRCYTQKIPMWTTLILWVTSLALGIVLFLLFNTSALGSFPIIQGN